MRVRRDRRWGAPCEAFNVQLSLDGSPATAFIALQTALMRRCPRVLHRVPEASLHVSVFSILQVGWEHPDKRGLWRSVEGEVLAALAPVIARSPVSLQFTTLRVTETALVALAEDEAGLLASARTALAHVARAHGLPTRQYDIVHATLARFAVSGELPRAACDALESLPVDVPCTVRALHIVRETVYPSLELEWLHALPLAGGSVRE